MEGEDFITRNKNIYEGIDASDFSMEIKDSSDTGDDGSEISYHVRMKSAAGTIDFDNKATVVKEDGDYRIGIGQRADISTRFCMIRIR